MNHREISELLPWYANQTLDEEERRIVEAHLAECSDCAQEIKSLKTIGKAVVESGNQHPMLSPYALNRALKEIEDYERAKTAAARPKRERATNFWSRWWKPTPVFARALIAVQVVLVVALGSVALYQYVHPTVIYTTSSGSSGNTKASARIAIQFNDKATEQQIRKTILGIQGKIVDGPSALGLYTIELPISREQATEIEQVLQRLRRDQKIVRFAAEKQ